MKQHGRVPQFLLSDEHGRAYPIASFQQAARVFLMQRLGLQDAAMFTTYSLRRSMPTLGELRHADEAELSALGDWSSKKNSSMPIRYADNREASALLAKLLQVRLVSMAADSTNEVSWEAMREFLTQIQLDQVRKQVVSEFAADSVVAEVREELICDLVPLRRRFNLRMLPRRAAASEKPVQKGGVAEASSGSAQQALEGELHWVAVPWKGQPVVHLLPATAGTPWCKRRRGQNRAQVRRMIACGSLLSELVQMGWGLGAMCAECLGALAEDQQRVVRSSFGT